MNFGGEAADQVVRYSLEGIDHGLRLSGTVTRHFIVDAKSILFSQLHPY